MTLADCRCAFNFTCGFCLRGGPVYFNTPAHHSFASEDANLLGHQARPDIATKESHHEDRKKPRRAGS